MKLTIDKTTDTATLLLADESSTSPGVASYTCGPKDEDRNITLRFDRAGTLTEVEIMRAEGSLPTDLEIRVTLDRTADAAYIYLTKVAPGEAKHNHPCDPLKVDAMIVLDFDGRGRLLGIEVLDASRFLPSGVLAGATVIG